MIDRGDNSANHNYEVVYYSDYRSRQLEIFTIAAHEFAADCLDVSLEEGQF